MNLGYYKTHEKSLIGENKIFTFDEKEISLT